MNLPTPRSCLAALAIIAVAATSLAAAPYQMEKLGRGVVALHAKDNEAYISWRVLGTDPADIAFNIYRVTDGGTPVKLNDKPVTATSDFVDAKADFTKKNEYFVKPVVKDKELDASGRATIAANAPVRQFLSVPIQPPPGGVCPDGQRYTYTAHDCSVADLDGDGEYEIILKWEPSNSKRPPQTGFTGPHIIDAYKMDGTRLWRINLGPNIKAGEALTQFMVYDFDGDGRAEMMCKTADGTIDGAGKVIGDATKDWRTMDPNSPLYGKPLDGPEFFTVFDGLTGKALATTDYIPNRYPLNGWGGVGGNGGNDNNGNRSDHFSAGVAYLDGEHPSAVYVRGWYGRSVMAAWDWRDGKLTSRWVFDSESPEWKGKGYSGQGNHQLTVGDFDGDGKDEVCIGGMTVDDNGKGLYTTGLRHGDALHAGDLVPARPGLEIYGIHENEGSQYDSAGTALFDAKTGEIIWSSADKIDVGRGMSADIDPNYPGEEIWGGPGGLRRSDTGETISERAPGSTNFAVWWDDDLLRELEDRTAISKWDWGNHTAYTLLQGEGVVANNGTKAVPCLTGDILGDWREEVIWRTRDNTELRIYSTIIPAKNRMMTLMHDPMYREAIAWQNVAYNQPPHPSFYIGPGMKDPPLPNPRITVVEPKPVKPETAPAAATSPAKP